MHADRVERGQHALGRRRRVEADHLARRRRAGHGIADSGEDRDGEHERRLAHRLRPMHDVLGIRAAVEERHAEVGRHVARGRDLVGGRRVRQEPSPIVPDELLGGEPAHALDEAALDLPAVDRRIDGAPAVVEHVDPQYAVLARERIDHDLGDRRAVGEVQERTAAERGGVPADLRRAVEAGRGERHPRRMGRRRELGEGQDVMAGARLVPTEFDRLGCHAEALGGDHRKARLDVARRAHGRGAVEIGAGRGGGRGRVRHLPRVGRRHLHALDVDAELGGDEPRYLGVEALAHLRAAVVQVHAAVAIDVDERARLIEVRRHEGDPELDRRQREPPAEDRPGRVRVRDRTAAAAIVGARLEPIDQRGQPRGVDGHAVRRHVPPGRVEVRAADVERITPEPARDGVDHVLHTEHRLRGAKATKGGVRDGVRAMAVRGDLDAPR